MAEITCTFYLAGFLLARQPVALKAATAFAAAAVAAATNDKSIELREKREQTGVEWTRDYLAKEEICIALDYILKKVKEEDI